VSLLGKLKGKVMSALLATLVKKLAEGDFGPGPAKAYWWMAGKKTWTALAMAAVAGALFLAAQLGKCDACWEYGIWVASASTILSSIGLFDGAVRIEAPAKPPFIKG
jgi:hypothetical protein